MSWIFLILGCGEQVQRLDQTHGDNIWTKYWELFCIKFIKIHRNFVTVKIYWSMNEFFHLPYLTLLKFIDWWVHFFIFRQNMRPLTDEETKLFFEKLSKYIGENIKLLIDRSDGTYCFRLHKNRVYYVSEKTMKLASNLPRLLLLVRLDLNSN